MYRDDLDGVAVFFQPMQAFIRCAAVRHPLALEPLQELDGRMLALGFTGLQQFDQMPQVGQVPCARRRAGQSQGGTGICFQTSHHRGNPLAMPEVVPCHEIGQPCIGVRRGERG